MSHALRHLLGCLVPILLIFLLPLFGVGEGVTLFVFIVLMFACHLFMIGGHSQSDQHASSREGHDHDTLSTKRLGFALGAAGALLYVGCVLVTLLVPHDAVVSFFNSLLHGINVEPIMRWDMPWWEALVGVCETFILGWLFGALIAALYNVSARVMK